ncbi:MAG: DUF4258 domain-containing protein [Candidatus Hydrogenedentota bacterium]
MREINIEQVRDTVKKDKYIIKTHAKQRMGEREVEDKDILLVIFEGEIIEQYPKAKPFPKCLITGFIEKNKPMYVSCAFDGEYVHIITVHWFDSEIIHLDILYYRYNLIYIKCKKILDFTL